MKKSYSTIQDLVYSSSNTKFNRNPLSDFPGEIVDIRTVSKLSYLRSHHVLQIFQARIYAKYYFQKISSYPAGDALQFHYEDELDNVVWRNNRCLV
jgi:hypothetical protein